MPRQVGNTAGDPFSSNYLGIGGEQYDQNTGLYYLRARYYDPLSGRFLSSDPADADANEYAYAAGDPVNNSDPSGLATLLEMEISSTLSEGLSQLVYGYMEGMSRHTAAVILGGGDASVEAFVKAGARSAAGRLHPLLGLLLDCTELGSSMGQTFGELQHNMEVMNDADAPPHEKKRAVTRMLLNGVRLASDAVNLATAAQAVLIHTSALNGIGDALGESQMVSPGNATNGFESEREGWDNGSGSSMTDEASGSSMGEGYGDSNNVEVFETPNGVCFVGDTRTAWRWTGGAAPDEDAKGAAAGGGIGAMRGEWAAKHAKAKAAGSAPATLYAVSRDAVTGATEWKRVSDVYERHAAEIAWVSLADAGSGKVVERIGVTFEHPFMTPKGWVEAGSLGIGTQILTRAGPRLVVVKVEREALPGGYAVFNATVEGDHSYFVGTAQGGAWVHNTCAGDHHLFPRSLGSLTPYGHSSLTPMNQFRHTYTQGTGDVFAERNETGRRRNRGYVRQEWEQRCRREKKLHAPRTPHRSRPFPHAVPERRLLRPVQRGGDSRDQKRKHAVT